ncbi:MAG: MarC family protein [Chlamydiales bacterium]|nr:MarC family protein [Chlamydiia bacterium]MCP5508655.1 MarC family protein [Chlamydiales bacterium]
MGIVLSLATTFFIIANPLGNAPAILTIVKRFDLVKQRRILIREAIAALLLALFFQYFGDYFLDLLHLKGYTVAFCGGILLFLVAISLIFPTDPEVEKIMQKNEPFIVPIATPLLAGPGLLTIIMLYANQEPNPFNVSLALVTAWIGVTVVLLATPYLQKLIGTKGIHALEQLMGMILSMIAMEMIVQGLYLFLQSLS